MCLGATQLVKSGTRGAESAEKVQFWQPTVDIALLRAIRAWYGGYLSARFFMADKILHLVANQTPEWLDFPPTVSAKSPDDPNARIELALASGDAVRMARIGRRQLTFEMWSMILGVEPPVPGVGHRNRNISGPLSSLMDAHALFQGIERPLAEDDEGADVLAYVIKPKFMYENNPNMVSVALKVPVPQDLVFVAYARLAQAKEGLRGTLTHWHLVEADTKDPLLPVDFSTRYRARLW